MTIYNEIYYHNNLIGTTSKYLEYKQQITIEGKEYLVVSRSKAIKFDPVNQVPDRAEVILIDRYDSKGNKLNTSDIVELDGYFYKIGSLYTNNDKEYVEYLNLNGSLSDANYACYCTKLTYEHYESIKTKLTDTLAELENAWVCSNGK